MRVITATALLLATMVCLRASASCFEKDIALSDVPLGVLTAARNAVEGLARIFHKKRGQALSNPL